MSEWRDSRLRGTARGAFYAALERFPEAYCRRHARGPSEWSVVTPDTALVIEGAPGSANSFAREAFLLVNPDARVASHLHSVAQFAQGRRWGVPLLALLRPPQDAIVSVVGRFKDRTLAQEIRRYVRFYRNLAGVVGDVELATFGEVTNRFGEVIGRVNERFGTDYVPFDHDDEDARREVFARIDSFSENVFGSDAASRGARPSAERTVELARLQEELASPRWAGRLDECKERYWLIHDRWRIRVNTT